MKPIHILFGIIVAAAWGTNFVAVKISLENFPPIFVAGARHLCVALLMLPFLSKPKMRFKDLYYIAFTSGVTFTTLIYFALNLEHGNITPFIILVQLNVPITAILGYFLVKEKVSKRAIIGIALAFVGAAIVVWQPGNITSYLALSLSLIVAVSGSLFNVKLRQIKNYDPINLVGWCSIINAPQLLILSLLFETRPDDMLGAITLPTLIGFLHTVLVSNILGFILWFLLLKKYPANLVVPFALLVPIFGAITCFCVLNQVLTMQVIAGGALTIIGIAIVNLAKKNA